MSTSHVFIVDEKTFPIHLQYMFAGTGKTKKEKDDKGTLCLGSDFVFEDCLKGKAFIGMIQDICRIRVDDEVFFYVCRNGKSEGEFFGVFKIIKVGTEKIPFAFESNNSEEAKNISKKLEKTLQFRVKIAPKNVYKKGVPETRILDSFDEKTKAKDLCWSLIYRKLKGERGCTPITEAESTKLKKELENINEEAPWGSTNDYSFDTKKRIINIEQPSSEHVVNLSHVDIKTKIEEIGIKSESILQTYILSSDEIKQKFVTSSSEIIWVGNEVFCSFGNSKIDILIVSKNKNKNKYVISPIELKNCPLKPNDREQILRYKEWCNIHKKSFIPAEGAKIKIKPILVTMQYSEKAKKKKIEEKERSLLNDKIDHYVFDEKLNIQKYKQKLTKKL